MILPALARFLIEDPWPLCLTRDINPSGKEGYLEGSAEMAFWKLQGVINYSFQPSSIPTMTYTVPFRFDISLIGFVT